MRDRHPVSRALSGAHFEYRTPSDDVSLTLPSMKYMNSSCG